MVSMKTKLELIDAITELIGVVGDRFDGDDDGDAERDFIAGRLPARLEATARELPTLSMHLLAAIADGPVSVVGLAARSGQLKGTVSKHVHRLVEANLVSRNPIPGNRKEVELVLTPDGKRVADVHRQLHDEMNGGFRDFLRRYSSAELQVLVKVLGDLAAASKDGIRLVAADQAPITAGP
ncbi:putative transcriptional regulator, MarR family protein [Mycolicibacterium mageritense]|uniref:Transcriptional regulator, MarR family protein n=2 Tax=Mycolicibacterium mageritense TaxID=53462 RepID=A0ABM7HN81_MYCME|nr:putative transcriptional regulator, MarR family protein [Mycolicibacterium mageritense]CDO23474.1 transcriptional regulator [Mycolicibacterium mageritense DSM 44476 = CIP 104973]